MPETAAGGGGMTMPEPESLTLKWGSLKGWKLNRPKTLALLGYWLNLDVSASAIMHHDTPEQKRILCELIDLADVHAVYLDWDGTEVTKEEAKAYIINYGVKAAAPSPVAGEEGGVDE